MNLLPGRRYCAIADARLWSGSSAAATAAPLANRREGRSNLGSLCTMARKISVTVSPANAVRPRQHFKQHSSECPSVRLSAVFPRACSGLSASSRDQPVTLATYYPPIECLTDIRPFHL
jgi:hypothetical protein